MITLIKILISTLMDKIQYFESLQRVQIAPILFAALVVIILFVVVNHRYNLNLTKIFKRKPTARSLQYVKIYLKK